MSQLNDLIQSSFAALLGSGPEQWNDVVVAYLKTISGDASNDPQDQWYAVLVGLGYSGTVQDMQLQYWEDILGYSGQWNDLYFDWLTATGGAFGPNVIISASDSTPVCTYPEAGSCTESVDYTANDSGFTNPANQWAWSIDPPVAGVVITAGATAKTCTVETQNLDADTSFNLKVIATDTVSTDSAERTTTFTHYHRLILDATIKEIIDGSCEYDSGIGETGCTSQSLYSVDEHPTPFNVTWELSEIVGGTAEITLITGTGNRTCYVDTFGDEPQVSYKLTSNVTSQFQVASDFATFTDTKTDNPSVAPVFSGPIPNQDWVVGVPITPLNIASYFTGTAPITYARIAGTWPDGISMDTAGLVTGTPTTVETETGLVVRGTNVVGSDDTNAFQADVTDVAVPTFHALTPDPVTHEMLGVKTGTGDVTVTHTAVVYAPDYNGIYQKFPANERVWSVARVVLDGGAGTDVDTVWGDDGGGTPLADVPYLQYYPDATNSQIYSNDLTNAEWTATTMTVAQDETGITGVGNTACTLTATAGNATVLANAITAASDDQATTWYMKRKTGTGNIDLTVDGGVTWQTVTLTSSFQKFTVDQAAVTDPQIGIRIVTSADAVIVGNAECYLGRVKENVEGISLGPIFTTTATVTTDNTSPDYDYANWDTSRRAIYMEYSPGNVTLNDDYPVILGTHTGVSVGQFYKSTADYLNSYDSSAVTIADAFAAGAGLDYQLGCVFSTGENMNVNADGVWGAGKTHTLWFDNNTFTSFRSQSYAGNAGGRIRELRLYDIADYAEGEALIDGLMP
jgi:hypothetical protein